MTTVDTLAEHILDDISADFRAKNLESAALRDGYVGASIPALETKFCADGTQSKVDFDLALKHLEESEFVKTGPMVPYENPPGSMIAIFAFFSKREYVFLTEKGYRAAQKAKAPSGPPAPRVHISGGTFNQSPIGIGGTVNQAVNFNVENDSEVVEYLAKLIADGGSCSGEEERRGLVELVQTAKTGDLARVKPIFQRVFGAAGETVKQVAWGVIVAYVTKKLGL